MRMGSCSHWVAVLVLGLAATCFATDFFVFNAAVDQPRVNVQLRRDPAHDPLEALTEEFDWDLLEFVTVEVHSFEAYLDTGASSYLLSNGVYGFTYPGGSEAPGFRQVIGVDAEGKKIYNDLERAAYVDNGEIKPVQFHDIGSVGGGFFNVSEPLYVSISTYPLRTGSSEDNSQYQMVKNASGQPQAIRAAVGPVPITEFTGYEEFNLVGMPALRNRVMVLDNRRLQQHVTDWNAADEIDRLFMMEYMDTSIHDRGSAAIPQTNRTIKLIHADFSGYTTTIAGNSGIACDLAHNPFIGSNPLDPSQSAPGIKVTYTAPSAASAVTAEGSFLFDTGAAASMISTRIADQLGIEVRTHDEEVMGQTLAVPVLYEKGSASPLADQFVLMIGGVGGQKLVAGFFLDSLLVRTEQGDAANDNDPRHIRYLSAGVLVNDIVYDEGAVIDPTQTDADDKILDGIFGMNFLTASGFYASYPDLILPEELFYAPFDYVVYDEAAGRLGVEISTIPEPGMMGVLAVGLLLLRRRRA